MRTVIELETFDCSFGFCGFNDSSGKKKEKGEE
jgi:hypothetical protein